MFFPEPKYQGGSVFNPSSYDCNNCCGSGSSSSSSVVVPTTPTVSFSAGMAATGNPVANVNYLVAFDTKAYDTTSRFNATGATVNGIPPYSFLPLVAGYYQINSTVTIQNVGSANVGPLAMYLYKNGIPFKRGVQWNPTVGYNTIQAMSTTASVYLNGTTDYLQINTSQTATGNTIGGDIVTNFFDGFLTANGQEGPAGPPGPSATSTVFLWDTWIYPNATATNAMTPPGTLSPGVVYSGVTGEGVVLNANSINTNRAIYWSSTINILDPTTTYTMTASCAAFGGQGPGDSYTMYIGSPNAIAGNNNGGANDGLKISIDFYNNNTYIHVNTSAGSFPFFSTSGTRFIGPFATWSAAVGFGLQNWFDLTAVIFTVGTQRICEVFFAGSKVASRNITNLVLSGNFLGVSGFSGAASAYIYTRSLKISRS